MSSSEITRACDADRERFIEHLNRLYAQGYIREGEAEELRRRILDARSLTVLESALSGFPQPENPEPPPGWDWDMPERFAPACTAIAVTGILVAVVPATALAHRADSLSNVLSAVSIVTGIAIFFCAVIVALCAGLSWEQVGPLERQRRRAGRKGRGKRR